MIWEEKATELFRRAHRASDINLSTHEVSPASSCNEVVMWALQKPASAGTRRPAVGIFWEVTCGRLCMTVSAGDGPFWRAWRLVVLEPHSSSE